MLRTVERRAATDSNNSPARTAGVPGSRKLSQRKKSEKRPQDGFGQTVNKSLKIKPLQFSGATASTRGASGHSAFSSAKMAKRALAQSLARELGPKGVHVAHVLVDGMVDNVNTRQFFTAKHPEIAAKFEEKEKEDGLIKPDQVAEVFLHLHQQHRTTWTQELDLRPWVEKW